MDEAAKGKKALEAQQYEEAITFYTKALAKNPTAPDYLIQRSIAFNRAKKLTEALADAENAVVCAQKRAKREFIIDAQFRRGCALYNLERFGDAELIFQIVERMDPKHKAAPTWAKKTAMTLSKLNADDERRKCVVKETPELSHAGNDDSTDPTSKAVEVSGNTATPNLTASGSATTNAAQTPADKIRYEWYQNSDNVYFSLIAKGVPQAESHIDIQQRSISISFPLANGSSYDLTLDPLFADVIPEKCIPRIMNTKIEIILVKATPGQKWNSIESKEPVIGATGGDSDGVPHTLTASTTKGPVYPTSSKSGAKDWDKVTREAQEKLRDSNMKGSTDDDDEFEGGDEANHFFKKLYKDAAPEVRRAMMKSYTESNGTALSTNWDEVSKAKVETLPPDGMEAKKW